MTLYLLYQHSFSLKEARTKSFSGKCIQKLKFNHFYQQGGFVSNFENKSISKAIRYLYLYLYLYSCVNIGTQVPTPLPARQVHCIGLCILMITCILNKQANKQTNVSNVYVYERMVSFAGNDVEGAGYGVYEYTVHCMVRAILVSRTYGWRYTYAVCTRLRVHIVRRRTHSVSRFYAISHATSAQILWLWLCCVISGV